MDFFSKHDILIKDCKGFGKKEKSERICTNWSSRVSWWLEHQLRSRSGGSDRGFDAGV